MPWVQGQAMLIISALKGLEGALHMTGSHLSAFEGFYAFTSRQWSTLLRAQECCSAHPRPGTVPTRLQEHAKKSVKEAEIRPDPRLVGMCCQHEHLCYGINEDSGLKNKLQHFSKCCTKDGLVGGEYTSHRLPGSSDALRGHLQQRLDRIRE